MKMIQKLLCFLAICYAAQALRAQTYTNPVVHVNVPDPVVILHKDHYCAVITGGSASGKFSIRVSNDLVNWKHPRDFNSNLGSASHCWWVLAYRSTNPAYYWWDYQYPRVLLSVLFSCLLRLQNLCSWSCKKQVSAWTLHQALYSYSPHQRTFHWPWTLLGCYFKQRPEQILDGLPRLEAWSERTPWTWKLNGLAIIGPILQVRYQVPRLNLCHFPRSKRPLNSKLKMNW